MENINWNDFEGSANYVKIKVGKAKKLTVDRVEQTLESMPDKDAAGNEIRKNVPSHRQAKCCPPTWYGSTPVRSLVERRGHQKRRSD